MKVALALAGAVLCAGALAPKATAAARHVPFVLQDVPIGDLQTNYHGVCTAGFDLVIKGLDAGVNASAYLRAAEACHLRVIFAPVRPSPATIATSVVPLRDDPALFGWLSVKEPSQNGIGATQIRALYRAIKRADPKHSVVALLTDLSRLGTTANPYTAGMADVVMVDWYPVTARGYRSPGPLRHAAVVVRSLTPGVPFWVMVATHTYRAGGKVAPTVRQLQQEVSDALAVGATGLAFHVWRHAAYQNDERRNPSLFAVMSAIARRVEGNY